MSKTYTITKIGQRRQVIIPKEVCDKLSLSEGDFVEVSQAKGGVLIKPRRPVEREEVLSSDDVKSLRRGLAEMKRGQTKAWDKVKHELEG